jgi:hypothetical protein
MVQKELRKFSQWFGKGFRIGMMEEEKMEWYKQEFLKLTCFSPPKILTSPFIWGDSWSFLSLFSILFLPLFFSLSLFLCSVSWGHRGFDDIRGEKSHLQKLLFKWNGMDWLGVDIDGGCIF